MKLVIGAVFVFTSLFSQMNEAKYFEYLDKTYSQFSIEQLKLNSIPDHFKVIDTRETEEYNISHIKGATLLSYNDFDEDSEFSFSKSDTILLYCSVGYRSSKIGEKLIKLGYTNVFNLYGGIFLWANNNNEVFNDINQRTNKVHGYNRYWARYLYNPKINRIY